MDTKEPLPNHKKHGAIISFIPSKKYLGDNTELPVEEIKDWLRKISYLFPKTKKITVNFVLSKGMKNLEEITYKSGDFSEILNTIVTKNTLSKPIKLSSDGTIVEEIAGEKKKKTLNLEFAFCYDDSSENIYDSYCNFTNTTKGGVHVSAVEEVLCRFLVAKTKAALTEKEKDKLDILWNDVRSGLKMVLNLSTNAQVEFQGNMKEEIGNRKLIPVIKESVQPVVEAYFDKNQDQLKNLIRIVKMNARVRIEANKVKSGVIKESIGKFNSHEIPNYREASGDASFKKELFLIEGERSAMGTAIDCADRRYQAMFGFRGMTANSYKTDISELLNPTSGNKEWVYYMRVLNCGRGKNFDISKCPFDKIIIMTDADIDGSGITQAIASFHLQVLPELVEAGRLYKVLPPLYSIGNNKKNLTYARNKEELVDIYYKNIANNVKLQLYGADKPMNKEETKEFLADTAYYHDNLIHMAKHYGVDKFLLENIVSFLVKNIDGLNNETNVEKYMQDQHFRTNLIAYVQESFPEIQLVGNDSLRGIVNYHEQSIQITNRFVHKTSEIFDAIRKYNYVLKVTENKGEPRYMSIGQLLDMCTKYLAKIYARFKGLGEMDAEELWDTTMNPDTRVLIRLTTKDLEDELERFKVMNSASKKYREKRKEMMKGYKVRREDLDN